MKTLRERCTEMLNALQRNAMLRQSSPVDDLMAFVIAERGRAVDPRLERTLAVCLYFGTEADRDDFIALANEAKPDMITKKLP